LTRAGTDLPRHAGLRADRQALRTIPHLARRTRLRSNCFRSGLTTNVCRRMAGTIFLVFCLR
jgi:hypothetical protein